MVAIVRTAEEIADVMDWVLEAADEGTHYKGQTYEEGIERMYYWLIGDHDDDPTG